MGLNVKGKQGRIWMLQLFEWAATNSICCCNFGPEVKGRGLLGAGFKEHTGGNKAESHFPVVCTVYEDDDELLWSPNMLAENKVRTFLVDVLSRLAEEKTGCDKPGLSVRDDEKVSLSFIF